VVRRLSPRMPSWPPWPAPDITTVCRIPATGVRLACGRLTAWQAWWAKATGQRTAGSITVTDQVAVAGIGGPLDEGELRINPTAAATIPPNSWAFIVGHEFAHRTHGLSSPNGTDPEMEAEADAIGARYAMNAGFDLAAHIDWTLSHLRDGWSPSHGSTHERALRLAARYGLPGPTIW